MTAIQLRAELFREMNPLLDSEVAMEKMLAFVRSLVVTKKTKAGAAVRQGWAAAAKQEHIDGQDQLLAEDVFEDDKSPHTTIPRSRLRAGDECVYGILFCIKEWQSY